MLQSLRNRHEIEICVNIKHLNIYKYNTHKYIDIYVYVCKKNFILLLALHLVE